MNRVSSSFIILIIFSLALIALPMSVSPAAAKTVVNVAVWGQFIEPGGPQPNLLEHLEYFDDPTIEVNLLIVPGESTEYAEKVLVMLATLGDDAPDLFIMEPEDANSVYAKQAALRLDGFLERDPAFAREILFVDSFNGQTVGIPGSIDIKPLAYHAGALDAAGLEDPNAVYQAGRWDLETFAQYSTRVTRREGNGDLTQIGFIGTGSSPYHDWPFIPSFGGRVMSDDGMRLLINSEETIAAFDWMTDQVVRDALVIAEFEAPGTYDRRGFGAVIFGQGSPTDFHQGLFPYLPEYVPYPNGLAGTYTMASFQPWIINADSKRTDAAWEVLKFIVAIQAEHQMHQLGTIPNQLSLIRDHIELQIGYGQSRTDVEAVWNDALNTFTLKPRYRRPDVQRILTNVTLDILGGRVDTGSALAEASRQINAILAEE